MNLRPISRICNRIQRCNRSNLYPFASHSFSSNHLDSKKNNIVPPAPATTSTTTNKLNKLPQFQSIQDKLNLPTTAFSSFWSLIAAGEEHRQWVQQYDTAVVADDQHTQFELAHFSSVWSLTQFFACNAIDGMQRVRMRALKRHLMCYEEFMCGSLAAFKSIQHLNDADQKQIARCFTPKLNDEVRDIKQALFSNDGDAAEYDLVRVSPFANQLFFTDKDLPELDMHFVVRYYYTLKQKHVDNVYMHRYADIEWNACWKPLFRDQEETDLERMQLKEDGFLIRNVEVDQC